MLKMADILDENDKTLRKKSEEVTFPLSKEDQKAIDNMIEYLKNSQTPELSEKYKSSYSIM